MREPDWFAVTSRPAVRSISQWQLRTYLRLWPNVATEALSLMHSLMVFTDASEGKL